MVLRSEDRHNELIIISLQGGIKRPLKDNRDVKDVVPLFIDFMVSDNLCNKKLPPSAINIEKSCFGI